MLHESDSCHATKENVSCTKLIHPLTQESKIFRNQEGNFSLVNKRTTRKENLHGGRLETTESKKMKRNRIIPHHRCKKKDHQN